MDETKKRRAKSARVMKETSPGEKLMTEKKQKEAFGRKLRHGRKSHVLNPEEEKKIRKVKEQGRWKIQADTIASMKAHEAVGDSNRDENVAVEAGNKATEVTELTAENLQHSRYGKKIHHKKKGQNNTPDENKVSDTSSSKEVQRKKLQRDAIDRMQKKRKEKATEGAGRKVVSKAETLVGKIGESLTEHVAENPKLFIIAGVLFIVIAVLMAGLSSCSMMAGGVQNVTIATSFTAEDEDILGAEEDYLALEEKLQDSIDRIETDYPDYDEYRYHLTEIGHDPYELAALLTVLYEDYTRQEVQGMLQTIFDAQYELTFHEIVERRTKEEEVVEYRPMWDAQTQSVIMVRYTYISQIEYEYYILEVTLKNLTIDAILTELNLTPDQLERYEILLMTYGNKPYLFGGGIYQPTEPGEYEDYQVPAEYLTDEEFANMIRCAEQYLGMSYVWGGSSPSTGFDCSGFVSYVINHSGNGWDVGRQSANGLLGCCQRISGSDVKPGDLVFFQGTYQVRGASHVGIYVGNGMMIHCGNPIQYTTINTAYWQQHFLTYGRINE